MAGEVVSPLAALTDTIGRDSESQSASRTRNSIVSFYASITWVTDGASADTHLPLGANVHAGDGYIAIDAGIRLDL